MKYELPKLAYTYNALEPYIDARTMEIHYTKHHQSYVDKLNAVLETHPELAKISLEELLGNLNAIPEDIRKVVQNHGGGHYNHSMFWEIMGQPSEGGAPSGKLSEAINSTFGDFAKFKEEFSKVAGVHFGSGWAWLVMDNQQPTTNDKQQGKLKIISLPNQDNPLSQGMNPVMGLDIWEHAYYLNYQSRRVDYINAWWNVVNWKEAEKNYNI